MAKPGSNLSAPAHLCWTVATKPGDETAFEFDLLVEVVEFFYRRHPDLGVRLQVAVQPGSARLLRAYSEKIRKHPTSCVSRRTVGTTHRSISSGVALDSLGRPLAPHSPLRVSSAENR